jgi:hypothetical protein
MSETCGKPCGEIAAERMRYFTGRYMSARDFADEQDYFLSHRYLHNRVLHGWGVACGLQVQPHPVESCRKEHVNVDCGMAIDPRGREIVVRKVVVPPPIPWSGRPGEASHTTPPTVQPEQTQPHRRQTQTVPAIPEERRDVDASAASLARDTRSYPLLCLEYCEAPIERMPVLYSERNCDEDRREFSRIAEDYKFVWHWARYSDLRKYHWKTTESGGRELRRRPDETPEPFPADDRDEEHRGDSRRCCLAPDCTPDYCVPIAWVRGDGENPITADQILTLGRPTLEAPVQSLTHISAYNWPHGGVVSRSHLERLKRLEIRFDRRLRPTSFHRGFRGPSGVNSATFVVQCSGRFVPHPHAEPPHAEHDSIAVFTIDPKPDDFRGSFAYLENQDIFITLKCDFILDCHDIPVDGDHLGGMLPTGDGVPGGTFESWFRVVPDEVAHRKHEWQEHEEPAS